MPICPSGHTSQSADYCDVCGDLIPGAARQTFEQEPPSRPERSQEHCPVCGTPRSGRFCEEDAYDFETQEVRTAAPLYAEPPEPAPAVPDVSWHVLINADRDYYESVIAQGGPDAASILFPPYCPERRVDLTGEQARIGRRSASRGLRPEIDLSEPPEDPGVSHMHAVLLAQPDGAWTLLDPGSTNGTTLNGDTKPLDVNVPVPVGDGDRVHVGAWTTLTLRLARGPR